MPLPSARASSGRRLGPRTIKATAPRNRRWTGLSIPTLTRLARNPGGDGDRGFQRGLAGPRDGRGRGELNFAGAREGAPMTAERGLRRRYGSYSLSVAQETSSPPGRPYPPPPASEPFWPAQATILAAIGLQVALPARLTVGPIMADPGLEAALLLGMFLATPHELEHEHTGRRRFALGLTGVRGHRQHLFASRADPLPVAPQRRARTRTDRLGRC